MTYQTPGDNKAQAKLRKILQKVADTLPYGAADVGGARRAQRGAGVMVGGKGGCLPAWEYMPTEELFDALSGIARVLSVRTAEGGVLVGGKKGLLRCAQSKEVAVKSAKRGMANRCANYELIPPPLPARGPLRGPFPVSGFVEPERQRKVSDWDRYVDWYQENTGVTRQQAMVDASPGYQEWKSQQ